MSDLKPIKIAGELFFTKDMHTPNTMFNADETRMSCTIGNLSERAQAALEGMGVKIKDREPAGKHIKAMSKFVFEPVDREGKAVDVTKIGYGTKVEALVSSFPHKMSKMHGNSVRVHKLIVTELKEFTPSMAGDDEEAL